MMQSEQTLRRNQLLNGAAQAVPVMLGYVPVGFAYGVLAQNSGVTPFNVVIMSLLVYAGSSQLVAAALFGMDIQPYSMILTTFVINLRHMLMSAAISQKLRGWSKPELTLFGLELTDETFALHSTRFAVHRPEKLPTFTANFLAQISWIFGSWLGVTAGSMIRDTRPFGLDFVLPAMFIALIFMQLEKGRQLFIALIAGALSILFLQLGLSQWNVILATVLGALIGALLEQWTQPPNS
ncbi:MAG: AzlC family ABC transporter permease [Anaerolineaceae bacterium]|nr:AzlC family ABC transporter permease [Anaerolineaceae bacterium]